MPRGDEETAAQPHGFGEGALISFYRLLISLEDEGTIREGATMAVVSSEEAFRAATIAWALGLAANMTLIIDLEGKDKSEQRPQWAEFPASA